MRALPTGMLLVILLSLSGLLCCQKKQQPHSDTTMSGVNHHLTVTFLYLPDSARTELILHGDSCILKRFGQADSLQSSHETVLTDSAQALKDSLLALLETLPGGAYVKEQVLDGTRIWIQWHGNEVYCDNCLNDYIREALGLSAASAGNENLEKIKNAVGMINVIIAGVEKGHDAARRAQHLRDVQSIYQKRYQRTITFADEVSNESTHTTTSEHHQLP